MLVQLIIGAVAMLVFMWLLNYVQKKGIKLSWWEWTLTVLALIYGVFVLEVIVLFLVEREIQGAAFMGGITAIVGVIWAVLLSRYVFAPKSA